MSGSRHHKTAAVIVAAGRGIRFGEGVRKQYTRVHGHPVLAWTLKAFDDARNIDMAVVAVFPGDVRHIRSDILDVYTYNKDISVVHGGEKRRDSVYNGLQALPDDVEFVAIHDGVRCAVTPAQIDAVCEAAYTHGAALPAVPVTDSLFLEEASAVGGYVDRSRFYRAQTPQTFLRKNIADAHERALKEEMDASDDGMIYKKFSGEVFIVPGSEENLKLTYPRDLAMLEFVLKHRRIT